MLDLPATLMILLMGKKSTLDDTTNFHHVVITWKRLTHCSLETPKRIIGKHCRPRSDAAERSAAFDQGLHCLKIVQPFFYRDI